jgi:hypothetical protein
MRAHHANFQEAKVSKNQGQPSAANIQDGGSAHQKQGKGNGDKMEQFFRTKVAVYTLICRAIIASDS